jgi:hypothetical protein
MNTLVVTSQKAAPAPPGIFHGMVLCQLGKTTVTFISASSDFGQVGQALLNAALQFLAKETKTNVAPFEVDQGYPTAQDYGSVQAIATVKHPTVPREWAWSGYAQASSGNFEWFEHSLASVVNAKGDSLIVLANKRAAFHIETKLGYCVI